jgi:hypothetical protein
LPSFSDMAHFVSTCFILSCFAILANPMIPPDVQVVARPYFSPYPVNGGTARTVIQLPRDSPAGVGGELTRYIFNCLLQ